MTETDSNDDSVDTEIRRVNAILESVAAKFAPDSEESLAIRDAALTFQQVQLNQSLKKNYDKLRAAFDGEISAEELDELNAKLRRYGIDPDELEAYDS